MTIRSIVVYEWKLMNWIDLKYVNMLSIRLERFKRVQDLSLHLSLCHLIILPIVVIIPQYLHT